MIRNISWIIEGEIAGMAKPASSVYDFGFIRDNGFEAIVSLSEIPLSEGLIEEFGFTVKHVVHCDAGIGRTGTMLACYLVSKGYNAEKAIEEVRIKRPGSIETVKQEEVIVKFARNRCI